MAVSLENLLKNKIIVTFEGESKYFLLSKYQGLKNTLFSTLLECSDKDKVLLHKN
jgi:hypothetical protein